MFKSGKRRLFVLLLTITALLSVTAFSYAASSSKVTISGYTAPTSIKAGQNFTIKGKLSSTTTIKRVEAGIVNASNNTWTAYKYDNRSVNARTFDLARADSKLAFSKLKKGTYKYRIYAHTSDGQVHIVLNKAFTVKAAAATTQPSAPAVPKAAAESKVTISGCTVPTSMKAGQSVALKGKITSNTTIKRIEAGIVNASSNTWTTYKYDNKNVNASTFDLSRADKYVQFSKLKKGTYKFRVYAHTSDGKVHIVVNKQFVVSTASTATPAKTTTTPAKTTTTPAKTPTVKKTTAKNTVTITGLTVPGNYKVGKGLHTKGIIRSKERIKRIEAGIVFAPTNKWTQYKYDNKWILSKTFDLKRVDNTLYFSKLPAGEYRYRIYVHTKSGVTLALNHKFVVKSSGKPQKAVNWAIRIANDNSFTYGAKPAANAIGCYFCGTNCGPVKYYKPRGYEKTYVCLTFVGAAYAHGAKDPEILSQCKRGRMTMYETDDNFTEFHCWMKIGLCKDLSVKDLLPGDVIVLWSDGNDNNGHVCMYVGGDKIVEAAGGGWGAGSIEVCGGASSWLRQLSYGKNYVMRYTK